MPNNSTLNEDRHSSEEETENFRSFCKKYSDLEFFRKLFLAFDLEAWAVQWFTHYKRTLFDKKQIDKQAILEAFQQKSDEIEVEKIKKLAHDLVEEYGAHFSGKLIHSDVQDTCLFAPHNASTKQPHISSRTVLSSGSFLALDQSKLVGQSFFSSIVRVLNNPDAEKEFQVTKHIYAALKEGATQAFCAKRPRIKTVDHRLRQILVPHGDRYLAISPLPGGWLNLKLSESVSTARDLIKSAGSSESQTHDVPGADLQTSETQSNDNVFFRSISFPIGGKKPQNVSLLTRVIQKAFLFQTPSVSEDHRPVWGFAYHPVHLMLWKKECEDFGESINREAYTYAPSDAVLRKIVLRQHQLLLDLADLLSTITFKIDEVPTMLDEDCLRKCREQEPNSLDLCLVNQDFGKKYQEAFSQVLVEELRHRCLDRDGLPIMSLNVLTKTRSRIELILKSLSS